MGALATGERAEQLALEHLEARGLNLITRNFRCRLGEIDLVMEDRESLVFVEVRFRKTSRFASAGFASAMESVDFRKQRKLTLAAGFFLAGHSEYQHHIVRFDVVALDGPSQDRFKLQWVQDAFRPGQ